MKVSLEERESRILDGRHEQRSVEELVALLAGGLGDEHAGVAGGAVDPSVDPFDEGRESSPARVGPERLMETRPRPGASASIPPRNDPPS